MWITARWKNKVSPVSLRGHFPPIFSRHPIGEDPADSSRGRPLKPLRFVGGGRNSAGFTLLEVLVALTILSMVFLALNQGFISNITIHEATRNLWKAMVYSRNEMTRWERSPVPSKSVNSGEFDEDHPLAGFSWKREITDETPFPGIRVRRISLELNWEEGTRKRRYRTETYVQPSN